LIRFVSETGSTNADVLARLSAGEDFREGDWLVADRQTAGKGRQGRAWSDGIGNFMGSTAICLGEGDPPAPSLALVAGLAVYEAVAPLVRPPIRLELKWPNDLLLRDAKLAGILLEREGKWVVAGIGVNLGQAPDVTGREVICLSAVGPAPDRDVFASTLAESFAVQLRRWRSHGLGFLLADWISAAHPRGTLLTVHGADGARISGSFDGLEPDGALRLRLEDGSCRAIHAGDVMLERN